MLRTIATVAIVWLFGSWAASVDPLPWAEWAVLAALGCVIITIHPAGRIQAIISGTFLATMIAHGAYGISVIMVRNVNTGAYLNSLHLLNILRVSLCAAWLGVAGVKMAYARILAYRGAAVAGSYLAHMD